MNTTRTIIRSAAGFSLIEVMVAVVVICIGLLGIAKMQAMAVSTTNMSRQRSLAAIDAASFASAMHSNREYWGSFTVNFSATISGSPAVVQVTGDPIGTLQADTAADLAALSACVGTQAGGAKCTAEQLAAFDLARWWANSLILQLPNPTATVSCPAAPVGNPAPVSCTIAIGWSEKSVALNAQEATQETAAPGGSASETPLFTLYVEP